MTRRLLLNALATATAAALLATPLPLFAEPDAGGWSATDTVHNPTNRTYTDALVRLKVDVPEGVDASKLRVTANAEPVPHQVDLDGDVWVMATLGSGAAVVFVVSTGEPGNLPDGPELPRVVQVLDITRLPPGTREARRNDGPLWRRSVMETAGGTRLQSIFAANQPWVRFEESLSGERGTAYTAKLDLPDANAAILGRWFKGPFQPAPFLEEVELSNDVTRVPGAIMHLQPRWTQGYDDGWFFGVTDGERVVGVLPIRAGQWRWPHDNKITAYINAEGDPMLRLPTWHGRRVWLLVDLPREGLDKALKDVLVESSFAPLNKLHNEYVLLPPDDPKAGKPFGVHDFYNSSNTNPTSGIRGMGRGAVKQAMSGKTVSGNAAAYDIQARFDPDWYGQYQQGWSPINPNFYSDFIKVPVAKAAMLHDHPAVDRVRRLAVEALEADINHSVTLPGGAGQECPGYQHHGAHQWEQMGAVLKKRIGYDLKQHPRWKATGHFFAHVSQPGGGGKRLFHPGGDTHPGRPDPVAVAKEFGYTLDPRKMVTEELPGFGVIFRDKPGTDAETYLAFKAGPNRGHYHGDQLSIHACFDAKPKAVDHWVSYSPRAGQEHMHNRVSLSTPDMPFANMDGYERTIAFKAGAPGTGDIAVAEVESPRLRQVKRYPPEDWDDDLVKWRPQQPIKYRRTIVMLKPTGEMRKPVFVIHDQVDAPAPAKATYNLHVESGKIAHDAEQRVVRFDGLDLHVVDPAAYTFESFPSSTSTWLPDNKAGVATEGARLHAEPGAAAFLTVLVPGGANAAVAEHAGGVAVGPYKLRFTGGFIDKSQPPIGKTGHVVGVRLDDQPVATLLQSDIDLDRSQGDIGLFVPDVGYPFGPIPDWLIEQRGDTVEATADAAQR